MPSPAFRLAIFDFDGTLADSFDWFCSVLDRTTARFGLRPVDPAEIPTLRDMPSRDVLAHLGVPMWKIPAIATYMRGLAGEEIASIGLFDGAAATLIALHAAGVKLAVVSSNAEANIRAALSPVANLIDRYDCGSALFGKSARLKAAAATFGTPAIAIGDEVRDIEAARKARVTAGAVSFGYNSRKALVAAKPDHLFDSYEDLLRVVLGG